MTREDTIRMAQEAGFCHDINNGIYLCAPMHIERFAALVRKEYSFTHAQMWLKRFDDAIKAEREACAKWLDERGAPNWAEQIRARGRHDD